jgi:hypothetical protein
VVYEWIFPEKNSQKKPFLSQMLLVVVIIDDTEEKVFETINLGRDIHRVLQTSPPSGRDFKQQLNNFSFAFRE